MAGRRPDAVTAFVFLSLSAVVSWLWTRDGAVLTAQLRQYAVWVLLGGFVVRLVAMTAYRRHAARRRASGVDPLAGLPTARPADDHLSTKW